MSEGPGTVIDRYKLLQQIGEGGMGVVCMTQREVPVKRKVALKIIKRGMGTKKVVARCEAERQALAMMDHPNVARVLDGGATETGWPYFVMELVQGVPITEFCDKNKLSAKDRIELFIPVCQAIQSAHQKGIIHRDIKPSKVPTRINQGSLRQAQPWIRRHADEIKFPFKKACRSIHRRTHRQAMAGPCTGLPLREPRRLERRWLPVNRALPRRTIRYRTRTSFMIRPSTFQSWT